MRHNLNNIKHVTSQYIRYCEIGNFYYPRKYISIFLLKSDFKFKVTLFGQSAGAQSIMYHLMSPVSEPLFHRVIMESNPASFPYPTQEEAINTVTKGLLRALNCTGSELQCLMLVATEQKSNVIILKDLTLVFEKHEKSNYSGLIKYCTLPGMPQRTCYWSFTSKRSCSMKIQIYFSSSNLTVRCWMVWRSTSSHWTFFNPGNGKTTRKLSSVL